MTFKQAFATSIAILAISTIVSRTASANDAVPFFRSDTLPKNVMYGPDLPDPVASECGARDQACIEAHDRRALREALAEHAPFACTNSTKPKECLEALDMVEGQVGMVADPVLDDPCSWVVLVDNGVAKIQNLRLGITRHYADRGWKPRTHLGPCHIRPSTSAHLDIPLPSWAPPVPVVHVKKHRATPHYHLHP